MTILTREETTSERAIGVKALEEAICLKCANCYEAMRFVNLLGGSMTDAWYLCHANPLKILLEEARVREVDLSRLRTSVDQQPVTESLYYKRAMGLLSEAEFRAAFARWQKGG